MSVLKGKTRSGSADGTYELVEPDKEVATLVTKLVQIRVHFFLNRIDRFFAPLLCVDGLHLVVVGGVMLNCDLDVPAIVDHSFAVILVGACDRSVVSNGWELRAGRNQDLLVSSCVRSVGERVIICVNGFKSKVHPSRSLPTNKV